MAVPAREQAAATAAMYGHPVPVEAGTALVSEVDRTAGRVAGGQGAEGQNGPSDLHPWFRPRAWVVQLSRHGLLAP
jgi:hypothetical protein